MTNRRLLGKTKINDLVIKKNTVEWGGIWLLLVFSFINVEALTVSLILLLLYFRQREIGAIKILNIITLRTIINPGIAVGIGRVQNIKWCIIFICSFYLIASYRKIDNNLKIKLNKVLFPIVIFAVYSVLASYITSTLPTVAIFKLISYVVVFVGIIVGVYKIGDKFNWLDWMYKMFMGVFVLSLPLLNIPIGYLRNGHSFQGITNQPNMFGILLVLFFAITLTKLQLKKFNNSLIAYTILGIVFYLGILSKSRTSLIAMVILIVIYLMVLKINLFKKLMVLNFTGIFAIVYIIVDKQILYEIQEFLYKGQENILYSRLIQIDGVISNFMRNPLFGSGFAVPVTPFRSFAFNSEYVIEPGNLILSVLSYGGILGFILFLLYIITIFRTAGKNFRQTIFLFLSPILISMGEMVFFSSNNIGVWIYMYLSIYIVFRKEGF